MKRNIFVYGVAALLMFTILAILCKCPVVVPLATGGSCAVFLIVSLSIGIKTLN